eukprot:m.193683 g.193683  ORF g.193683 m.193683 type:complete len:212 (+) comp24989_c0_seq1:1279-1914(+)
MPTDMSDVQLSTMSLQDLKVMMEVGPYSTVQIEAIRARRRKIQNRNSAKTSSARKHKQFESMSESTVRVQSVLQQLRDEVIDAQEENTFLRVQNEHAQHFKALAIHQTEICRREVARLQDVLASATAVRGSGMQAGERLGPTEAAGTAEGLVGISGLPGQQTGVEDPLPTEPVDFAADPGAASAELGPNPQDSVGMVRWESHPALPHIVTT